MKFCSGFGRRLAASCILAGVAILPGVAVAEDPHGLEPEESDVATISPPSKDWFYVRGGWEVDGTGIYDGKSGKMVGMVSSSQLSDMAIDPGGKYYYVSETIWSKGNRGTRQDMVTVYDSKTLNLVTEIEIPGRILVDERMNNFIVSTDGKWGYVYSFSPASAVNVVDMGKQAFVQTVELPGCSSLIPNPTVGFSALCSDGTMATVSDPAGSAAIVHSEPFFRATDDPIFENFAYDASKNEAIFLTYTGQVFTAKMGATPEISAPFSLQGVAGYAPATSAPMDVAWYPGTRQPMAYNAAAGELYVLMHMGEYWSHKALGEEIWVLNVAARKIARRIVLEDHAVHLNVTQGAEPLIFINDEGGEGIILDGKTGEELRRIPDAGLGLVSVASAK